MVTTTIIIITVAVSIIAFSNRAMAEKLLLAPIRLQKEPYRIFTYALVHGDYIHLAVNMLVLYSFGQYVEQILGTTYFLVLYISSVALSTLPTAWKQRHNYYYRSVGASGAVSAITFCFIFHEPWAMLSLFFFIPIPAILFGVLYLIYSYYMSKRNMDNIGHETHFYGALVGFVFPLLLNPGAIQHFISALFAIGR